MIQFLLKLLFIFLSQHVAYSYQYDACVATAKNQRLNNGYSFALAKVQDPLGDLGPQESCYFSCGAQLVTFSNNMGDMKQLTAVDKAMPYLGLIGFLKIDQSYFVNHLGASDKEGGNGVGCVHVESEKKIKRYPRSHPVCSKAKSAICGFWGKQSIPQGPQPATPSAPSNPPPSHSSTKKPKPSTPKPKPSTSKPKPSTSKPKPSSSPKPSSQDLFEVNERHYSVHKQSQESFQDAQAICSQSRLGAVSSTNMQAVSNELKKLKVGKAIVGSWNGDTYALSGANCLILDTQLGIYPSTCSVSDAVLCQL